MAGGAVSYYGSTMGVRPFTTLTLLIAASTALPVLTGCSWTSKPCAVQPVHDARHDERELLRIEEDLHAAYLRHDAKYVGQLLSDDFLAIDASGNGYGRTKQLADLSDPTVCEYITPFEMRVRVYGDSAVVTG